MNAWSCVSVRNKGQYYTLLKIGGRRKHTGHKAPYPSIRHPYHRGGDDPGEVGTLSDAVGVVGLVQKDSRYDLGVIRYALSRKKLVART